MVVYVLPGILYESYLHPIATLSGYTHLALYVQFLEWSNVGKFQFCLDRYERRTVGNCELLSSRLHLWHR